MRSWLVHVCNQLEDARKSNKSATYIEDIADERMKLLERCKILINMWVCYTNFEKSITDAPIDTEESEYSEIRKYEKSLLCATCIELTRKNRESATTFVYNEHVSHVDEYIKQSAQYAHKISTDIKLVCYYGHGVYAKDMQTSLKELLLTVCQVANNAYNMELFIASRSKETHNPEEDSAYQSSNAENEAPCSICFEALAKKRSISLTHCKHRFHRTCALLWFESQYIYQHEDSCPLCRSVVPKIFDEHDVQISQTYPYESEKERLLRDKIQIYDDGLNLNRRLLSHVTRDLRRDRMHALKNGRSKEWIADIDEEIEKNRNRSVELDKFDWMSFKQREMDVVAEERARNGIAAVEGNAPEEHIEDDDNSAAELPSEENEEAVVDETSELTTEDVIPDDIADDQARNNAFSTESDAPEDVVDSSDNDVVVADDDSVTVDVGELIERLVVEDVNQ